MKVTTKCFEGKEEYPYIGVFPDGQLVLFLRENTGICLGSDSDKEYNVGEYSTGWIEINSTKYTKCVILAND